MSVIHRGHELTQPQLDCFTIILNEQMNGKHRGQAKLEAALEAKCVEKGCPIPEGVGPHGLKPEKKRNR